MAATKSYQLLCLENPLLDIQAQADEQLLKKYELKANDAILAEEKHMGLYEDLLQNYKAKLIAGGAAQNTARGAQYILPADSVVFVGCVGRDKYSDILKETADKAGLRVEYRYDDEQPTGRCGVIITGYDRSMVTHLAAANHYKVEHIKSPDIWPFVQNARLLLVGGYHLTVCMPAIMALAEEAAGTTEKSLVLTLSAPFIPTFFKDQLDTVLPYTDFVVGNETEALSYAESHGLGTTNLHDIARNIALSPKKVSSRPRTVVITHGTEPTIVAVGEGDIKTYPVHVISKSDICDTNGAGDAFTGGFLAGIIEGKPLDTCVDMGHWLASLSIRELGPSYPFPW